MSQNLSSAAVVIGALKRPLSLAYSIFSQGIEERGDSVVECEIEGLRVQASLVALRHVLEQD